MGKSRGVDWLKKLPFGFSGHTFVPSLVSPEPVLTHDCTMKLPGKFLKILTLGSTARDSDFIGMDVAWHWEFFQSSLRDSKVQPR